MDDPSAVMKVEWREWGAAAFEEARADDTPVLLSITAAWCGWCQTMDATTYADPGIAAMVNHDFVPVRADADRYPRVRDRYNVGGFPSTIFLTPDGHLVAAASFLEDEQLRQMLTSITDRWEEEGDDLGRLPHTLRDGDPPEGPVTADIERYINGQVDAQFDDEYAGWGTEAKFPLPVTVEFALKRHQETATDTLDAIRDHLFDPVDGGFFRHAGARDWSDPTREKLLDVNAGLLRAFAHAYLVTGDPGYRDVAARTVGYLADTLWTGDGFATSQLPGEYFELSPSDRRRAEAPPTDGTVYAGPTAQAADALTWFVAYTDDETASDLATSTLDLLEREFVDDGVVAHTPGEAEEIILAAQAPVVEAFASAAQVLDSSYAETAAAVAEATIDHLRTDTGAFRDGPAAGPALLDRPLYPIDDNARIADALVDLHHLTGEDRYLDGATEVVGAFAGAADQMGPQVAGYGTVASRVVRHPLVVAVGTAPGADLHRAALRMADHEKVVVPESDGVDEGCAALLTPDGPVGEARSPEELASLVVEYEPRERSG
ncbi:MAG: DUF255 domain-containing protein [Halanaeroarchaeum sp.]